MKIGMTLPVMEPGLTRQDLEAWTKQIDSGPWSHIALGERVLFSNPEFISTLSAVAAWTTRVEIIATISVLTMHDPVLSAQQHISDSCKVNKFLFFGHCKSLKWA